MPFCNTNRNKNESNQHIFKKLSTSSKLFTKPLTRCLFKPVFVVFKPAQCHSFTRQFRFCDILPGANNANNTKNIRNRFCLTCS